MADNVTFQTTVATPASGVVVSTEEISTLNGGAVTAQHVQRIAVSIRTGDGVAIDLPGDSSNGLDVDVTRIVPGTGATNLGKAEDAAHSSGDTGVMALGVRQDADSAFGADGDYSPFQFDNNGFLKVNIKAGAGSGGTAMTDDSAFTVGASSVTPMGALLDDTTPDSVNEGDIGAVRMSANRILYHILKDGSGLSEEAAIVAGGQLYVYDDGVNTLLVSIQGDTVSINTATSLVAAAVKADDSAFTPAIDKILMIGAVNDDISPDSVNEGDAGALRMSANRNLYMQIRDAGGNERGVYVNTSNELLVSETYSGQINGYCASIDTYTGAISATVANSDANIAIMTGDLTAIRAAALVDDVAIGNPISVLMFGALFDDAAPDSVDEGDAGAVRMSANRNLYVTIRDAAGNERGLNIDANGALAIGSIVPGTGATNLGKAEDAAHSSGDTGVMALGVRQDSDAAFGANGDYAPFQIDALGFLKVASQGNVAHDAADAGNPVKIGAKALAHGSNPTAVAAGDRTDLYANRHGIPFVISGHPNILTLRANYTAAQTDTAIITQGAGGKIVVTRLSVTADNANSVDVQARVGFGSANTPTTTGVLLSHPGIAPGSGVVEGSGAGILGIGADGDDLRITSEVPTGGSIDVLVSYYTIES